VSDLPDHYRQMSQDYDPVDHPAHYGGDSTYEAIRVIEAWDLGFCLGNVIKYVARAGRKNDELEDLEKASWYLNHHVGQLRKRKLGG